MEACAVSANQRQEIANMTRAEELFQAARSHVPDPANPKKGDTYIHTTIIQGKVAAEVKLVVTNVENTKLCPYTYKRVPAQVVHYYIEGKQLCSDAFELMLKSMRHVRAVVETLEVT